MIPDARGGRMAVRFAHQNGDIASLFTDDLNQRDIAAFRGGLRYTGIADTTVALTGSCLRNEGNSPFYLVFNTPQFPISGTLTEPNSLTTPRRGSTDLGAAFRLLSAHFHQRLSAQQYKWTKEVRTYVSLAREHALQV